MLECMKRVLVIGVCGAGKSTLAAKIHEKTGLPLIHLDQHYWNPGWVETPNEVWRSNVSELSAMSEWVMDGNYASSFDIRIPRADTIIYLDYSRSIALWRATIRTLRSHGRVRKDMADGCQERFNWAFLRYVWTFHQEHRPKVEAALTQLRPDQTLVRLTAPGQAEYFLQTLS
jgi:adenylate kinase family enzyme